MAKSKHSKIQYQRMITHGYLARNDDSSRFLALEHVSADSTGHYVTITTPKSKLTLRITPAGKLQVQELQGGNNEVPK